MAHKKKEYGIGETIAISEKLESELYCMMRKKLKKFEKETGVTVKFISFNVSSNDDDKDQSVKVEVEIP